MGKWNELAANKGQSKSRAETHFVDCFASWCGPCKWMDKEIYPNDSIGNAVNPNFIAIKVQFDTTKNDNDNVKNWYQDANYIRQQYDIASYPTFLFMSPDGELIHKDVGAKTVQSFVELVNDALNPNKQYYTLLKKYEQKKLTYPEMGNLAKKAVALGDKKMAKQLANDYINNYLAKLKKDELLTQDNVQFLVRFTGGTKDKSFWLLYNNQDKIKQVFAKNPYYVSSMIEYFIAHEEVDAILFPGGKFSKEEPDWKKMKQSIKNKFNAYYADKLVLDGTSRYYAGIKNYDEHFKYVSMILDKYAYAMSNDQLNTHSWNICQYSFNDKEVAIAAKAMERVVKTEADSSNLLPASVDTYANLLYRLGKK